eukprot:scaffold6007_cov163-Isochrysis_galbana.AAC.1
MGRERGSRQGLSLESGFINQDPPNLTLLTRDSRLSSIVAHFTLAPPTPTAVLADCATSDTSDCVCERHEKDESESAARQWDG